MGIRSAVKNKTENKEKKDNKTRAERSVETVEKAVKKSRAERAAEKAEKKSRAERAAEKAERGEKKDRKLFRRPALKHAASSKSKEHPAETIVFSKDAVRGGSAPSVDFSAGGFDAMVRSSQPIMTVGEEQEKRTWIRELLLNLACSIVIMAFISLFLAAAEATVYIPFALAAPFVFLALTTVEIFLPGKVKWISAAVLAVIMIVLLIVFRHTIIGGMALVVNQFYDIAEQAQAYIYDRFAAGESAYDTDGNLAVLWASGMLGLLAALPPSRFRPAVSIVVTIIAMFAFAYYGILPSKICIAVLAAAMLFSAARGNYLSRLAAVLAVMLLFGAVLLIDPGENNAISRMDEDFRDKFALSSVLLEDLQSPYDEFYEDEFYDEEEMEDEDDETIFDGEYGSYFVIGIILLIVAAIGALCFLLWKRFKKRRNAVRAGLDSSDDREAVTAMFPYSVRWLKYYGMEQPDTAFTSMVPAVRNEFSNDYARRFMLMYNLWSEAAYSDHEISGGDRHDMERFMKDTVDMIEDRCKLKDKLRLRVKHAL